MISNDRKVKVTNRDNGTVSYVIPDLGNLKRVFTPKETKEITYEELKKLSYIKGGKILIKNYLIVQDEEVLKDIIEHVEPEYFYSDKEATEILLNGTLEQLEDCLNFGPEGVKNIIIDQAIKNKIYDTRKMDLILQKTGFNVANAIKINQQVEEELGNTSDSSNNTVIKRKAAPIKINNPVIIKKVGEKND